MSILDTPLNGRRSPHIDVLRACLALWVLSSHLILWTAWIQGPSAVPSALSGLMKLLIAVFQPRGELHPAVVCFIVLSGYCIHRNGLRRQASEVPAYGVRRFFRIYPVYALATLFGIACYMAATSVSPSAALSLSGTSGIQAHCAVERLTLVSAAAPDIGGCGYQGNQPLDTVMVEMLLYAVYPILLLGLARRFGERTLWLAVFAVTASGVLMVMRDPSLNFWWQNSTPISFLVYWWIGVKFLDPAFALATSRFRLWILFAWFLMTDLLLGNVVGDAILVSETRKIAMALLFGLLVVRVDRASIGIPAAVHVIGKSGYSLYAFHAPLVYLMVIIGLPWWLVAIMAVGLGLASYRLVERPSIAVGRRLATRRPGGSSGSPPA